MQRVLQTAIKYKKIMWRRKYSFPDVFHRLRNYESTLNDFVEYIF